MKQNNLRLTLVILLILLLIASVLFALYKIYTKKNYDIIPNIIRSDTEYIIESKTMEDMINYLFADDFKTFNVEQLKNYSQIQTTLYTLYSDSVLFEKIKHGETVITTYSDGQWILLINANFKAGSYTELETGNFLGYTYISPNKVNKKVLGINSKEIETAIASMSNTSIFHILEKTKLNDNPQWISHDFYYSSTNLEIISFYIPASKSNNKLTSSNSSIIKTFTNTATSFDYKFKDNKAVSKLKRQANIENKISVDEISSTLKPTEVYDSNEEETDIITDNETDNQNTTEESKSNKEYLFKANSNIIYGPQHLYNHTNVLGNIIIQDDKNEVYFLTTDGNKKWSVKVDGPIIGQCTEIDFYHNNKVQYLFNTNKRLYLFDINGNEVNGFPVILPLEAASNISLYSTNSNTYHIYYVGTDNNAHIFKSFKNDLKSIKTINNIANIDKPIKLFTDNKTTYVAMQKQDGSITFLTTSGGAYFNTDNKFKASTNSCIYENNTNSKANIITNDNKGNLAYLQKGKTTQFTNFGTFDSDNIMIYEDINNDNKPDFIFIDKNHIVAYDRFTKEIFSAKYNLNNTPDFRFINNKNNCTVILFAAGKSIFIEYNKKTKKHTVNNYDSSTTPTVTNIGKIISKNNMLIQK